MKNVFFVLLISLVLGGFYIYREWGQIVCCVGFAGQIRMTVTDHAFCSYALCFLCI